MQLEGKVAVVTGGGGGIGRGMALAFAEAGMKVAVADVDASAVESVCKELEAAGTEALAFTTNVMEREALETLAEGVYSAFGGTHVLCNNAGVTTFETMDATTDADWSWVLGVNLHGVVHGLQAFLPRMKAQAGEKHVVNTSSIAGLLPMATLGPYVASKYAVLGISESLRIEGKAYGLSCSVLCPGNVNTGIVRSARNRPDALGGASEVVPERVRGVVEEGLDPEDVGRLVRAAVEEDSLYVFTHPEQRAAVAKRFDRILAAFDQAREQ